MKTFSIHTLGCKVNQYESQQFRQLLQNLGLSQFAATASKSGHNRQPNLIIVNSCCVTHIASSKTRQYIRKAKRQYPNALIILCGCLAAIQKNDEIQKLKSDKELVGDLYIITDKDNTAEKITQIITDKYLPQKSNTKSTAEPKSIEENKNPRKINNANNTIIRPKNAGQSKQNLPIQPQLSKLPSELESSNPISSSNLSKPQSKIELTKLTSFEGQTRAFLKVQDGCDGYCSYCIIPQARPKVRNKPLKDVIDEAQLLVNAGHKEIVVTGIFLGAYGLDTVRRKKWPHPQNNKLAELLEKLAQIPNLQRIRTSSIEPADVTPELIDVFQDHPNIMPHLHLSLQSGAPNVLRKMCRQYDADDAKKAIDLIKNRLDRPAVTCDLIVGFPGETDSDFKETIALAEYAEFAKMHVFSFSPRKGTSAVTMKDTVSNQVIKQRSRILRELDSQLAHRFRQQFVGQKVKVLLENSGGKTNGRTERYFMVELDDPKQKFKKNTIIEAEISKNKKDRTIGEVVL